MDSRLLNVFHDDPFDGSYTQLNADFWSGESDTMGQLTETLNGILPIAAEADQNADIYSSTTMLDAEDHFRITKKIDSATNLQNDELLIYDDFTQHQLPSDGAIEIITVDPNSLDSDTDLDTDDTDDDDIGNDNELGEDHGGKFDDNQSQYSDATFRTRTDSSSIGDYESHTSDYDDSSDDEETAGDNINNQCDDINTSNKTEALLLGVDQLPDLTAGLLAADGVDVNGAFHLPLENVVAGNKNRTMSTNTIDSDVDVNNFDLAEFITNDNLSLNVPKKNSNMNSKSQTKTNVPTKILPIPVKQNLDTDSDADSDVIVDIETVDVDNGKSLWEIASKSSVKSKDNGNNDVIYEDNVKEDPSWSPKCAKKQDTTEKEAKTRSSTATTTSASQATSNPQNTRNFTIIPSKRQCDILKGKANNAKNKSSTKHNQGKSMTKKGPEITTGNVQKAGSLTCRVGVGQSGKNLALLSQNSSTSESKSQTTKTAGIDKKKLVTLTCTVQETQTALKERENEKSVEHEKLSVKRKLNLEEYKRRRDNAPPRQTEGVNAATETQFNKSATQSMQIKHSEEVKSVVKSLRNQAKQKTQTDPITEAKNKVLRMQELKRAQQLKIIDSTISAKVPRVTKLPPLKDIVKDTCYADNTQYDQSSANTKLHPDYEELIIVSAGCNTEISIPPLNTLPINTCERSLLKSSALLYNMPKGLTSSSSLIASIQDVFVQKVVAPEKTSIVNGPSTSVTEKTRKQGDQHGEDKVIMHLRKDRIRPRTVSVGIQTDLQPGFAYLPKVQLKLRSQRNYRKHSGKGGLNDSDSDTSCGRSRKRSRSPINRSRSRSGDSYASSLERTGVRQCDNAGGYSSRSSRRHRSSISSSYSESGRGSHNTPRQSRTSYKKRSKKYARNSSDSSSSSSNSDFSDRSRSRSRSRSPYYRRSYSRSRSRSRSISRASNRFRRSGGHKNFGNISQPAVEERRIVYVGRIEEETTKEMLRRKFLPYGIIKQISIHYKDTGMKYGFVTYERSKDAFTVIDSSARDPVINMYDISFGGRRAFCRSSYADLDNAGINTYHSVVFPKVEAPPKEEDSFEALLQKVKAKMNANKSNSGTKT